MRDLDVLVYLLSKLSEDKGTVGALEENAKMLQMPMDKIEILASGTKMTEKEVSDVSYQTIYIKINSNRFYVFIVMVLQQSG